MPRGPSRRCRPERFGFYPKPWAHTWRFQSDVKEKVQLPRNPLYKQRWGSCGVLCCVKRCFFNGENAMRQEPILLKTCVWRCQAPESLMLSSQLLYQYFDRDEAYVEGEKYRVEVALFLSGLLWRISSHSNNLTISWHHLVCADNLCASARSRHWGHSWSVVLAALRARGTWWGSCATVSRQNEFRIHKEHYLQLNIEIFVSVSGVYLNSVELYLQPKLARSTVLTRRPWIVLSNLSGFVLFKNVLLVSHFLELSNTRQGSQCALCWRNGDPCSYFIDLEGPVVNDKCVQPPSALGRCGYLCSWVRN